MHYKFGTAENLRKGKGGRMSPFLLGMDFAGGARIFFSNFALENENVSTL